MKLRLLFVFTLLVSTSAFGQGRVTDLMTTLIDLRCSGGGHHIDMHWDTTANPFTGNYTLDGRNVSVRHEPGPNGTNRYDIGGAVFTLERGDTKRQFEKIVSYRGQNIRMNCTYNRRMQFLRERAFVEPADPDTPVGQAVLPGSGSGAGSR
ncbi:MAG: hypothetical protein V4760_18830 [Bdellovibrionota bacterium]